MTTATVLITGGTGMVGRNLQVSLRSTDYVVLAPSSTELDLMNERGTLNYLENNCPDIIVHCAGHVGGIQANIREPANFLTRNLSMGQNLLLAARQVNVPKVINLGSSCMYPRNSPHALREEEVLSGTLEPTNEGYAIAKCAVGRLCDYINREDPSKDYVTLIPCNLYGVFDKFDPSVSHLIPAIVDKLHRAKCAGDSTVEIWGDGEARREFMFASDLADAISFFMNKPAGFTPKYLNIGIGQDISVSEYYRVAAEVIGFEGVFTYNLDRPVGMSRKLLDVTRQTRLGWYPKTKLIDGIKMTYTHYLALKDNK